MLSYIGCNGSIRACSSERHTIETTTRYEQISRGDSKRLKVVEKHLGPVDPTTISRVAVDTAETETPAQEQDLMSISVCQNLDDIEAVARRKLSRKAWIYFSSAADSLESLHANRRDWSKITFRPRVLRNVTRARMKRRVMGHDSSLPFFIAPAAMAKLGHPDGEKCLADGAAKANIVYCTSTYSSVAHEELSASFRGQPGGGTMTFQLYVPKQKEDAARLIEMARKLGCKALVITVDTPVVGRREEDDRYQAELEVQEEKSVPRTFNLNDSEDAPVYRGFHNSTLDWDDIGWLRSLWGAKSGPVYIKGIQTVEDALAASQIGVDGIYLSNHGGRQLDFAPSSIRTLLEIRKFHPELLKMTEIYLDGGVRRGTDIVKALCFGATAVGLGRPFHYALSAFGTDGVLRVIECE